MVHIVVHHVYQIFVFHYLKIKDIKDIKDILWYSSKDNNQSQVIDIGNKLMVTTEEETEKISKWLYDFSTDIPRIVEYSLEEMINQTNIAGYLIDWEKNEESLLNRINITPLHHKLFR